MKFSYLSFTVLAILAASGSEAVMIDFELGAPNLFFQTNPLREEYAGLGVHFTGPNPLDGGAVLNHSSFTPNAVSGTDFLAFNTVGTMQNGGRPIGPERVDFDVALSFVSVWYSGSGAAGELQAYDSNNVLLGSHSGGAPVGQWTLLQLSGVGAISWVRISSPDAVWVLDDLTFTPVPEPGTFIAIGIGLAGLAIARRRR